MTPEPLIPAVSVSAATAAPVGGGAPAIRAPAVSAGTGPLPRDRAPGYLWAVPRLCLGWTFLWPFLDKTFGLGHETPSGDAWISGGNPTKGFLSGSIGPLSGLY